MNDLERLGKEIAELEDEILEGDHSIDVARAAFQRDRGRSPRRRVRRSVWFAAAAVAAAATVALAVFVNDQGLDDPPSSGRWLQAPEGGELVAEVLDDGRIELSPGTAGRLFEGEGPAVVFVLEHGTALLDVEHRLGTDWRVAAGPYEIRVTGTRFLVRWQPEEQALTVDMHQGEVIVLGPSIPDGQRVRGGYRLQTRVGGDVTIYALWELPVARAEQPLAGEPSVRAEPRDDQPPAPVETVLHPSSRPVALVTDVETWDQRALRGETEEALRMVRELGLDQLLAEATAEELLLLGDVARLSDELELAARAYGALRERFGGTGHAATAALNMGRMAFDQQQDYERASHWFGLYLDEQQGSSLGREALGRLLEAQIQAGDDGARQTAQRYLASFPEGPHAEMAREAAGVPRE